MMLFLDTRTDFLFFRVELNGPAGAGLPPWDLPLARAERKKGRRSGASDAWRLPPYASQKHPKKEAAHYARYPKKEAAHHGCPATSGAAQLRNCFSSELFSCKS